MTFSYVAWMAAPRAFCRYWPSRTCGPFLPGAWQFHIVYKLLSWAYYQRGAYTVVYPVGSAGTGPLFHGSLVPIDFFGRELYRPVQWLGVGVLRRGDLWAGRFNNLCTCVPKRDYAEFGLGGLLF